MNVKLKEWLGRLSSNGMLKRLLLFAGIAGIALIFLSNYLGAGAEKTESDDAFSVKTYSTKIESDLENVISQIEGAGKTKVLLTVENSVEYVYLKDSTTKTKEVQPVIRGVLVVCEGGGDPVTVERVTDAVTKALDITTSKICVTKLSY